VNRLIPISFGFVGFVLGACSSAPSATDSRFTPPLAAYAHVFHGAPANGSLPNLGKADATYPATSTELLASQSPVKDQNERGICTIFTTTGLMEHLYIKAGMASPSFSEQYLQWAVKSQLMSLPMSEGSNINDNVEAIHQFGIVTEDLDPYNGFEWTAANDPDCKPDGTETQSLPTKCWTQGDPPDAAKTGTKYFLPEGEFINTTDIKAHITSEHTAVGVGIDFFYQAWNHGASTLPIDPNGMASGVVRFPNDADVTASHTHQAGHGILIVGWDDTYSVQSVDAQDQPAVDASANPVMQTGFYIFKNSWGTTLFGENNPNGAGYGYISEQYIEQYATAYVSSVPDLSGDGSGSGSGDGSGSGSGSGSGTTCQYQCSDYGYIANQCVMGWQCDAEGQCLTPNSSCP
jgi:C1A family cysteine protease